MEIDPTHSSDDIEGDEENNIMQTSSEHAWIDLAAMGFSPQRDHPHYHSPAQWLVVATVQAKVGQGRAKPYNSGDSATAMVVDGMEEQDGEEQENGDEERWIEPHVIMEQDLTPTTAAQHMVKKRLGGMLKRFAMAHAPVPLAPNQMMSPTTEDAEEGAGGHQQAPQSLLRLLPLWSELPLDEQTLEETLPFGIVPPMQGGELTRFHALLHETMIFPAAVPTSPMLVLLDHTHAYTPTMMNHEMLHALYILIRLLTKLAYQRAGCIRNKADRDILFATMDDAEKTREKHTTQLYEWLNVEMEGMHDELVGALSLAGLEGHSAPGRPKKNSEAIPRPVDTIYDEQRERIICRVGTLLDLFFQRYVHLLETHAFILSNVRPRKSWLPKDKWPDSGIAPSMPGQYGEENPWYWSSIPKPLRTLFSQAVHTSGRPIPSKNLPPIHLRHLKPITRPMFLDGCSRVMTGLDDVELLAAQLGVVRHAWRLAEGRESENPFFTLGSMSEPVRDAIRTLEQDKRASLIQFRDRLSDEQRFQLRAFAFLCYLQARLVAPNYKPSQPNDTSISSPSPSSSSPPKHPLKIR